MSRVLLVSHERLRRQMSGPSIRNWELARTLARGNDVTLAAPGSPEREGDGFYVAGYDETSLAGLVANADVVLAYGFLVHEHPVLLDAAHLAIDLYGPFELENLHQGGEMTPDQHHNVALTIREVVRDLLLAGDVFFCASERQRDFWMGWLDAVGRINPVTHTADPGYSSMVRLLPIGVAPDPPRPGPALLRGVVPGIEPGDFVVLWGGGIWDWFDPEVLIRAAAATEASLPRLRVVFTAAQSPSEKVPIHEAARQAQRLAEELGVRGRRVFFNESWIAYDERGQMYLESDVGVSLHREDVETRFSFRNRVLDYLWGGLPIISTEGDSMADLVAAEELGAIVRYGSVESLVEALVLLATDGERRAACAARSAAVGRRFTWPQVAEPLLDYCRSPHAAPDRRLARARMSVAREDGLEPQPGELRRLLGRSAAILRHEGPVGVVGRGARYLRRRAGGS